MATILKIKRSTASGTTAPAALSAGELAVTYGGGTSGNLGERLMIGNSDGTAVLVIGGKYFADLMDHTPGSLTASSAVLTDSNGAISTLIIGNNTTSGGKLELREGTNNGSNAVILKSPNSVASDLELTLPGADGSAGQPLVTDGSGALSFGTITTAINIAADTGSADGVSTEETITFEGGTGIDTTVTNNKISTAIDSTVVTKTGSHTLTNKTLASPVFTTQFSIGSAIITEAELETIDGITPGTAGANKALVLDASRDLGTVRDLTSDGTITAAAFHIGAATIVEVDLEQIEDITAGTALASKALVVDSNKDIGTLRNITSNGSFSAASGTFTGNIVIGNGAYIGSTSDTDAIQIEADGDVVLSQDLAVTGSHTVTGTTTLNGAVNIGDASADAIAIAGTATFTPSADFDGGFTVASSQTVDMGGNQVTNVADPTQAQSAATKAYVDAVKTGLNVKDSVKLASTAALAASTYANGSSGVGATLTANANGALSLDSVAVSTSDRVLIKNQADASQNGIYTVTNTGGAGAAFVLTRATDADTGAEIPGGTFVFVTQGSALADNGFVFTHNGTPTIGTTDLTVAQFSGAGQIDAGAGLTKSGNTLAVQVDDSSIEINSDTLQVKASGITNAMLAGSIDLTAKVTGTLPVANGGTGAASLTANRLLLSNGTSAISVLAAGTAGQVMTSNGASAPAFGDIDGGTY